MKVIGKIAFLGVFLTGFLFISESFAASAGGPRTYGSHPHSQSQTSSGGQQANQPSSNQVQIRSIQQLQSSVGEATKKQQRSFEIKKTILQQAPR